MGETPNNLHEQSVCKGKTRKHTAGSKDSIRTVQLTYKTVQENHDPPKYQDSLKNNKYTEKRPCAILYPARTGLRLKLTVVASQLGEIKSTTERNSDHSTKTRTASEQTKLTLNMPTG